MYISNGFVCGNQQSKMLKISEVKALDDMIMILTFSTGEKRLFDATILEGQIFEPLKNPEIFKKAKIEYGVVTWMDGNIDCAPEFMYEHSYEYSLVS